MRHGLEEELHPDDSIFVSREYEWDCPMPFHPTCMEVFKRVSSKTSGRFDVDTLIFWRWSHDGIDHRAHAALNRALQISSTWHHENGDEWLAANPILVPALTKVLQPALIEDGILFSEQDSAFPTIRPTRSDMGSLSCPDPFVSLPREILNLIIDNLESYDIAVMRPTPGTFTHLPIFLWNQLLLKEMPWLWEFGKFGTIATRLSGHSLPRPSSMKRTNGCSKLHMKIRHKQERNQWIVRTNYLSTMTSIVRKIHKCWKMWMLPWLQFWRKVWVKLPKNVGFGEGV